jgi:bifunctional lysine-specific demethylase and histidyl-hydroxylase NO66
VDFTAFLAPFPVDRFVGDYYGVRPLHIAAEGPGDRAGLMDWARLSDLLEVVPQWSGETLKLIIDSRPVGTDHYVALRETGRGPVARPDPGMIEAMMAMGASLVADALEDVAVDLRRLCAMLGARFGAKAGVNAYCSFAGVQAFASHCDPHEVFAVQCEGEKRWRIYANRADQPISGSQSSDQAAIDAAKGPVLLDVVMRPGDLLYIPRGYYHDAVASSARSLHLTFGVQPLYGLAVIDLLRDLAGEEAGMRAYLPPASDGDALETWLHTLGDTIASLVCSRAMREDIAVKQRTLSPVPHRATLPDIEASPVFVRTAKPGQIVQPLDGSHVACEGGTIALGLLSDAARWTLDGRAFSIAQLRARFSHHPVAELDDLLDRLATADLIAPHR